MNDARPGSEPLLRELTERLPGMVFQQRLEPDGRLWYPFISGQLTRLTPDADMMRSNARGLIERIHEDDRSRVQAAVAESVRTLQPYRVEYRVQPTPEQVLWLRTEAQPHAPGDGAVIWNGFTADNTAEREAETRVAAITQSLPAAVFQLEPGPQGRLEVTFVSAGIEALLGVPASAVMRGELTLTDLIVEEDRALMARTLRDALCDRAAGACDVRVRHQKTGQRLWVRAAANPNASDPSRITWSGFWWDITDIKILQDELALARETAEAAHRIKSEFLANMSHEIRTPMNAIVGLSQQVLRADPPESLREPLRKIAHASRTLLQVINSVLDYSRIEAGRMPIEQVPFLLDQVLEDLVPLVAGSARDKGLAFSCTAGADVPRNLLGDPHRLGQVLLNLASNAVKFTERGMVRVAVERLTESAAGVELRFVVEDSGVGLSAEQQQRLFVAFSQADTSTTRKYGGSGLGLSICKSLIEKMGGRIGVASAAGSGSRFWFTLTLQRAPVQAPVESAAPPSSVPSGETVAADAVEIAAEPLRALNQSLARHEARAIRRAQELAEAYPAERALALAHRQAAAYDFESARVTLLKLSARLKIPL